MEGELKQVADLALFAKIVQTGGISRCAADLGLERTTISRRLGSLERTLGVKLLDRTPKNISVTDAGRRCLEQCELLLESARNATSLATIGGIVANTAPIVIGAPPDLIDRYLEPKLREFESDNPGARLERRPVSIWNEETINDVDLGIALAPVAVPGGWTNTLAFVRQSIFASTEYMARNEPVKTPFDLENHDCIVETTESDRHAWSVAIAREAVPSEEVFVFHKTTNRRVYERARASVPAAADLHSCVRDKNVILDGPLERPKNKRVK